MKAEKVKRVEKCSSGGNTNKELLLRNLPAMGLEDEVTVVEKRPDTPVVNAF